MVTENIIIQKITVEDAAVQQDIVALEEQYHVEINGSPAFSFTCTPDHLKEMVTGALFSCGFLTSVEQLQSVTIRANTVQVQLSQSGAEVKAAGKQPYLEIKTIFQTVNTIFREPDSLSNRTGCAHSCSVFQDGKILCTFEDIGRHNALDKVIGFCLLEGIPMDGCAIFSSGRISGDYMAKIIHARFPIAVSRAAVTSEAVRLAKEHGVTLYGFVRGKSANLYT